MEVTYEHWIAIIAIVPIVAILPKIAIIAIVAQHNSHNSQYNHYIGSCPSRGDADSILGADPHQGILTLYWELPLMRGY